MYHTPGAFPGSAGVSFGGNLTTKIPHEEIVISIKERAVNESPLIFI
jgi:hypothetical protein